MKSIIRSSVNLRMTDLVIPLSLSISLLLTSCKVQIGGKSKKDADTTNVAAPVAAIAVSRADIASYITLNAVVEPGSSVEVTAQIPGVVESVMVEEGDRVVVGQNLVLLDSRSQQLALDKVEANLDLLRANLERSKSLLERNMLPGEEYARQELTLREAEIAVEEAQLALERTHIVAPFTGIVVERSVEKGDMVSLGKPLCRLVDESRMQIDCWINESDLRFVRIGDTAFVYLQGDYSRFHPARISRISPVVDARYGKVKVTLKAAPFSLRSPLKPGQYVQIRLRKEAHTGALQIPKRAVVYESGTRVVYVVSDTLALRRQIRTGIETSTQVEILEGLSEGDSLIVEGQAILSDSARVRVVEFIVQSSEL